MNRPDQKNGVPDDSSTSHLLSDELWADAETGQTEPDGTIDRIPEQNQDFCRALNQQIHDLKNLLWPVTLLTAAVDAKSDSTQLLHLMRRIGYCVEEALTVTVRMSELLQKHSGNGVPEAAAESQFARRIPSAPAARLRILCVDDDLNVRRLLRQMLTFLGHDVLMSSSGSDALKAIASDKFDVVLTEKHLMDVNGHNITNEIRAICPIPIIWLTQSDDDSSQSIAADTNSPDGFLVKPLSIPVLRATLDRIAMP